MMMMMVTTTTSESPTATVRNCLRGGMGINRENWERAASSQQRGTTRWGMTNDKKETGMQRERRQQGGGVGHIAYKVGPNNNRHH
jgi:hypothetical protein